MQRVAGNPITECLHHSCSLCRCEHQQLQLLLRSLPRRLLGGRRRRGELRRWGRVRERRRKRLPGELGGKGSVQLRRCQEGAGRRLCGRPVASFPGEDDHIQPLGRLRRWDPVNKANLASGPRRGGKCSVCVCAELLCFYGRELQRQFLSRICSQGLWKLLWVWITAAKAYLLYYFSVVQNCVSVFMFFPFGFSSQAPPPQEGGARTEVFHNCFPLLVSGFLHPPMPNGHSYHFIKPGFLLSFFPESEIRARLQSASPTPCRCKTTWIHSLSVTQLPMKHKASLFQRNSWMFKAFYSRVTLVQHFFNSSYSQIVAQESVNPSDLGDSFSSISHTYSTGRPWNFN